MLADIPSEPNLDDNIETIVIDILGRQIFKGIKSEFNFFALHSYNIVFIGELNAFGKIEKFSKSIIISQ